MLNWLKENKFRSTILIVLTCLFVYLASNSNTLLNSDNGIVSEENVSQIVPQSEQIVKVFYSPYCPHCHHLNKFIDDELRDKYPSVNFEMHNISNNKEREMLKQHLIMAGLDASRLGTPTVFVGSDHMIGFGSPETSGKYLIKIIDKNFYSASSQKKTLK